MKLNGLQRQKLFIVSHTFYRSGIQKGKGRGGQILPFLLQHAWGLSRKTERAWMWVDVCRQHCTWPSAAVLTCGLPDNAAAGFPGWESLDLEPGGGRMLFMTQPRCRFFPVSEEKDIDLSYLCQSEKSVGDGIIY